MRSTFVAALMVCAPAFTGPAAAQEGSGWEPIPAAEWNAPRDSASPALMLFEKVLADERKLGNDECYLTVHRRIKLFTRDAVEWADVRVEYDPEVEKIELIEGRTVRVDGTIAALDVAAVHDREVIRAGEASLREKFFTLPAVADTCIVEYRYRKRSEHPNPVWIAQKSIPLVKWEYRWQFYNPEISAFQHWMQLLFYSGIAPNYLWVNSTKLLDVTMVPDEDNARETIFRTTGIPAFEEEPHTLPDEALKAHLRAYYSSNLDAAYYWTFVSDQLGRTVTEFGRERDELDPVIDSISALPPEVDRAAAAFDWIRRNIRLVKYSGVSKTYKENRSINDVMERRYGEQSDVNILFSRIMEAIPGHRTFIAVAADRTRRLVYKMAKYWQFDRMIVGVVESGGRLRYHSPGDPGTVPGQIPAAFEGTGALVVAAAPGATLFVDLPSSDHARNRRLRRVTLALREDGTAGADVEETLTGHQARAARILLEGLTPAEHERVLRPDIAGRLAASWGSDITGISAEGAGDTVRLRYTLSGPGWPEGAPATVVKPFSFLPEEANPFVADHRRHPIMFEYAESTIDTLTLVPGPGRTVKSAPVAVWLANRSGSFELRSEQVPEGVRIFSRSILRSASYARDAYQEVRAIVSGRGTLRNAEAVVGPASPGK